MQIVDLTDDEEHVKRVAELLKDGFSDTGTEAWSTLEECLKNVRESIGETKISRIALGPDKEILGWGAGAPLYRNYTWELEVLVVDRENRLKGIGSGLLGDFESEVKLRGGLNVFLGTDDENFRTSVGGTELYPEPLSHLKFIQNISHHPFEFYQKKGYEVVGVLPDANGIGKPDIFMSKRLS
ncbi:MAG: GNAT family N-acetyltransferase [Acidobacteriota bacterium]|nr:GNAT family N-acetyltransferase [Acidobacteriota bacterium]MDH3529556.1 GNAT family N-acetyltransferase [Acidobacteriota bacterium]